MNTLTKSNNLTNRFPGRYRKIAGMVMLALIATSQQAPVNAEPVRGYAQDHRHAGHLESIKGHQRGHRNPGYVNQDSYVSDNIYGVKNLAYYGDWDSNRIYIVDVDNMQLLTTVEGTGEGPYGIDQQSVEKAYALTRKTESLTVVNNKTLENTGLIPLNHKPRSTNYNPDTGLTLVSGADKAMTSVIRVSRDRVIKEVGDNQESYPYDFGGSLSTGHPLWLNDHHFFMLDRASREIQLWSRSGKLLSVLATPTSVHHLFQPPKDALSAEDASVFFAVAEGNQETLQSPGILRFEIINNQLKQTGQVELASYAPERLDAGQMGSHHADFHPDGIHIYIGSAEGHVFVVNKNSMEIVTMIDAGKGAGHTTFAPMRNLAFITNHNATYMTVIDTKNHQWLKNIEVADSAFPEYKSQSHTSGVSMDMQHFYSMASHDGVFFEIDMNTLEVSRRVYLGGNLLMGSFIWDGEATGM